MTPEERLKGQTVDISFLIEFQWYQRVWYIEPVDKYEKCHLGRWLGPCNTAGGGMVSWILTMKATEEVRTSVIPLTQQNLNDDEVRLKVKEFDKKLIDKLKERAEPLPTDQEEAMPTYKHYNDDDTTEEDTTTPDVDICDRYISARLMLPSGDSMVKATIIGQKRDTEGALIGNTHRNPILDIWYVLGDTIPTRNG